jgi:hypothetical protein
MASASSKHWEELLIDFLCRNDDSAQREIEVNDLIKKIDDGGKLLHNERAKVMDHVFPKDKQYEIITNFSKDVTPADFDLLLCRAMMLHEEDFGTLLHYRPVCNKIAERNVGVPQRAAPPRKKSVRKGAQPVAPSTSTEGEASNVVDAQESSASPIENNLGNDDDPIDIGSLLMCAESSHEIGRQYNKPDDKEFNKIDKRHDKGGKLKGKGNPPTDQQLVLIAKAAGDLSRQTLGCSAQPLTETDLIRGAVTERGTIAPAYERERNIELERTRMSSVDGNQRANIDDEWILEPIDNETNTLRCADPLPTPPSSPHGRNTSDHVEITDEVECPEDLRNLYTSMHPFGWMDHLDPNTEVEYDKGMLNLRDRSDDSRLNQNPPLVALPAFQRRNSASATMSLIELSTRHVTSIWTQAIVNQLANTPSFDFPSSKSVDTVGSNHPVVVSLTRVQMHEMRRAPLAHEPACAANRQCVGWSLQIQHHTRLLAVDHKMFGNLSLPPQVQATQSTGPHLCFLCLLKHATEAASGIRASNSHISVDEPVAAFCCITNQEGEYRDEDVFYPPPDQYLGLMGPLPPFSTVLYTEDERKIGGVTVMGLTEMVIPFTKDGSVGF